MREAIELMRYYLGEYVRLVGASAVPEHLARAQLLLDWLRKKDKREVTAREVSQSGPNPLRNAASAKQALADLEEHGWVWTTNKRVFHCHALLHVWPEDGS
jgi:DNA-binding IclR family transcriptional regulator